MKKYTLLPDKTYIIKLIEENKSLNEISAIMSDKAKEKITAYKISYFLNKHGIEYKNRPVKRKKMKKKTGVKCKYCGRLVKEENNDAHLLKCKTYENYKYLITFKDEMVNLINDGYGLNSLPKLLGIKTTRAVIEFFCKIEGINYIGKHDFKKSYAIAFGESGNPSSRDEVKKKKEETFLRKYGVRNPFQHEDIILASKITKLEKYGTLCVRGESPKGRMSIPHVKVSKILTAVGVDHENEKHGLIYSTEYTPIPDIFVPKFNLVIEIYGDFWHANPKMYSEDDIFHTFSGRKTAKEIWEHDYYRENYIRSHGYNFEKIWESDITEAKIHEILSNYKN